MATSTDLHSAPHNHGLEVQLELWYHTEEKARGAASCQSLSKEKIAKPSE